MARDITASYFANEELKNQRRYKVDPYALQQFYKQSDEALDTTKKMIWLASMGLLDTISTDSDAEAAGKLALIDNRRTYFQPKFPVMDVPKETEEPIQPPIEYHKPITEVQLEGEEEYEEEIPIPKLNALEHYDLGDWNKIISYDEYFKKMSPEALKQIDDFAKFVQTYGADKVGRFSITTGTDATPITYNLARTLVNNISDDEFNKIMNMYGYKDMTKEQLLKLHAKNRAKYDNIFQNMLGNQRYNFVKGALKHRLKQMGLSDDEVNKLFMDYDPAKHVYGKKIDNRAERYAKVQHESGSNSIKIKKTRKATDLSKARITGGRRIYKTPDGKVIYEEDINAGSDIISNERRRRAIKEGMERGGYNYMDDLDEKTMEYIQRRVQEINQGRK